MIPAVGFMVATYTIFRFVETIGKPDTSRFVSVLGVIGILVTLVLIKSLWDASTSMPSFPYH